ncbi:MAG TPA: hypothetical protein VGZ29_05625 [Terriglobia bacterium]|nr:hypothetical protein [Terriglobia bacterium]
MPIDRHLEAARQDGPVAGWKPVESIPLQLATYCVSCDQVVRSDQMRNGRCPICGSESTLNLARALYREGEAVA